MRNELDELVTEVFCMRAQVNCQSFFFRAFVVNLLFEVNVVNVGERRKNATFITYPSETKGAVKVVNVLPGYFAESVCRAYRSWLW